MSLYIIYTNNFKIIKSKYYTFLSKYYIIRVNSDASVDTHNLCARGHDGGQGRSDRLGEVTARPWNC